MVLTGTSYKLFLQPVLIDAFSDDPSQKEERHTWRLCGLRSSASLEWEAMAISYTVIIWLTVLFFAICMGGPILKLFLMNNRERLRLRELGVLGLFLVLLSGVFTLAGLQSAYFHSNDDDTEGRLQQLSENLSRNIHLELRLMRNQLVAMCRTAALKQDLAAAEKRRRYPAANRRPTHGKTAAERAAQVESCRRGRRYPNFNNAFWTDDDGHQIIKWSPGDYVTPLIDMSGLRVFSEPKTAYLDATGPPLRFDSVLPPNRLEYLVALGMNTKDCNPELNKSGIRGDIRAARRF